MSSQKFFTFIFIIFCCGIVSAQSRDNAKNLINQVLAAPDDYLYGDATSPVQDASLKQAVEELKKELNTYAPCDDMADEVIVGIVTKEAVRLTVTRGNCYRAFVYINKAKVDSIAGKESVQPLKGKETLRVLPIAPVKENSAPVEVTATAPKSETFAAPTAKPSAPVETPTRSDNPPMNLEPRNNDVVSEILRLSTLQDLGEFLPSQKENGKVLHYDNYQDLQDPVTYYLVVCDRTGHIVAVLSPGRDERMNLKTQQADKVTNYWGHKIIGFTL